MGGAPHHLLSAANVCGAAGAAGPMMTATAAAAGEKAPAWNWGRGWEAGVGMKRRQGGAGVRCGGHVIRWWRWGRSHGRVAVPRGGGPPAVMRSERPRWPILFFFWSLLGPLRSRPRPPSSLSHAGPAPRPYVCSHRTGRTSARRPSSTDALVLLRAGAGNDVTRPTCWVGRGGPREGRGAARRTRTGWSSRPQPARWIDPRGSAVVGYR